MRGTSMVAKLASCALMLALGAACGFGPKPDLPPVLPTDLFVGSNASGGGALAVLHDFAQEVELTPSANLGPLVLYASIEPAFDGLTTDDPGQSLFVLDGEISVTFELVAIDDDAQVRFDDVVLSAPGDTAQFAMGPGGHFHPEWRVTAPSGTTPDPKQVVFRIADASGRYGASAEYTLTLVVSVP